MPALLNRKELFDRLANNEVDLYFTKIDGTKRRMRATLMHSITGVLATVPGTKEGKEEHGQFTVYDIDKSDWRSFLIERVSTVITPSLGEIKTDGTDSIS